MKLISSTIDNNKGNLGIFVYFITYLLILSGIIKSPSLSKFGLSPWKTKAKIKRYGIDWFIPDEKKLPIDK